MPAIIQLKSGDVARVNRRRWSSDTAPAALLEVLRETLPPATGADPNPDQTAARAAIKALGGKLLQASDTFDPADVGGV